MRRKKLELEVVQGTHCTDQWISIKGVTSGLRDAANMCPVIICTEGLIFTDEEPAVYKDEDPIWTY